MTIKVHKFKSAGEAYDTCMWNEEIKSGDVLVIASEGVVGIAYAWPFAVTEEYGDLHGMEPGYTLATMFGGKFAASEPTALAEIAKLKPRKAGPIRVRYEAVDGAGAVKTFKTIAAARRFAHYYVGANAEVSTMGYAVSSDGVGKVTVSGAATITDLFPAE